MTLQEFIEKYKGKQVEYHSFGSGALYQCVDLVNQYIKEVLDLTPIIGTNAKDFPEKARDGEFEYIENTPEGVPLEGDLIVWDENAGGGYGHISIFIDGNTSSFRSFDQNWGVKRCAVEHHYYKNVRGWMRPIKKTVDISPTKRLPDEFYKINEFENARDLWGLRENDAWDSALEKANNRVRSMSQSIINLEIALDKKAELLNDCIEQKKALAEKIDDEPIFEYPAENATNPDPANNTTGTSETPGDVPDSKVRLSDVLNLLRIYVEQVYSNTRKTE